MVTNGLEPIEEFQPPQLSASGTTALGAALRVLQQSLDNDVKPAVKGGGKGDWKPLVFILTGGWRWRFLTARGRARNRVTARRSQWRRFVS